MPIYRIRRYSGYSGGKNFYHHADVISPKAKSALSAAEKGRVWNWRWVDTFDSAPGDYEYFEFLYPVSQEDAKDPQRPKSGKLATLERKLRKIEGVIFATVYPESAVIFSRRSNKIFRAVRELANNHQYYKKVHYLF